MASWRRVAAIIRQQSATWYQQKRGIYYRSSIAHLRASLSTLFISRTQAPRAYARARSAHRSRAAAQPRALITALCAQRSRKHNSIVLRALVHIGSRSKHRDVTTRISTLFALLSRAAQIASASRRWHRKHQSACRAYRGRQRRGHQQHHVGVTSVAAT